MKKKILAVVLAATMVIGSAISAFAASLDDVDCTGWWVAHSSGVEVTEEGVEITFHSVTYDSATFNWNTPVYILYGGNEGVVNGDGYTEYFVCRSDLYGWAFGDTDKNTRTADWGGLTNWIMSIDGTEASTDDVDAYDWATWLAANKTGVDCTLTAKLDGSNVVVTLANNGLSSTATIPVDTTQTIYVSISGESCTLTQINVESLASGDDNAASSDDNAAASDDNAAASDDDNSAASDDNAVTTTGDVATIVMIVAMVGAAAALVVLKKRVTE